MSATATGNVVGPPRKRIMTVLIFSLIMDMFAFTSILPLFPSILQLYSKDGHRDKLYDVIVSCLQWFQNLIGVPYSARYNNVFFGGLLGSMFSALQFLASPTLGALSDVYGRRQMLLLSSIGTLISYILWLRASTFTTFVLSRIIGGLSKANVNVATAMISDLYSAEEHPKGMALIGVSYSIGFLIGPMFGAYFSTLSSANEINAVPAVFSIVLTVLQFLLVACYLPETLDFNQRSTKEEVNKQAAKLVEPKALFNFEAVAAPPEKRHEMRQFGIVYFTFLFLYSGLEFTLPFLTHMRFNFTSVDQGKIYLFCGLIMLPIQGHFVRKTPMHRQKSVAQLGIMLAIPAFLIVATAHSMTTLYSGLFLYSISSATVVTSLTSCVSAVFPKCHRGVLAGVFRSIGALARALGPVAASTVFWLMGASSCYTIGGILLLLPLLLLRKTTNPVQAADAHEKKA